MQKPPPFNPLDKGNLAESAVRALLAQPLSPLPPQPAFLGAGVYAIYYWGESPLYRSIAAKNLGGRADQPIYVGKATPAGGRKGGKGLDAVAGAVLHKRLLEHADTVKSTGTLSIGDFGCKFLVVDDIFIGLTEALLITKYQPVWNMKLDGFGNHDPGKGRYGQQRSVWDTVHPGRSWAEKCEPNKKSREALEKLLLT